MFGSWNLIKISKDDICWGELDGFDHGSLRYDIHIYVGRYNRAGISRLSGNSYIQGNTRSDICDI